ncbi:hypothetical protein [Pelobacter seleniigenes]|uniref:hypothetical protein n=1 Tax=Pelobacter seleniigenes TaxID=407188 RepID=UPI0012B99736|nr:hypothetical protein [Pelobacter seleniigenes]
MSIGILLALLVGLASAEEVRYSKYNIHTQTKDGRLLKASYANYTDPGSGHVIIPAGSKIFITDIGRKSFEFTFGDRSKKIVFEYHSKRMGMDTQAYIDLITSPDPVSFEQLSELDKKGMAEGKVYKGMSKDGVLAAFGYPAAHRTASLDAPSWTYWTNRFGTVVVEFDDHGKVANIID